MTDTNTPPPDHIDALCLRWAAWVNSRRFYGPPPIAAGILGKLASKSPMGRGAPDAECAPELPALHLAIAGQPKDTARAVFEAHYLQPPKSVKAAAATLRISRSHWYVLLRQFRERVYSAHLQILADNLAAAQALPHRAEPAATCSQ